STDLLEHMAFKTLQPDAVAHFGLEDVFTAGDAGKLAWVSGWGHAPHLTPEVTRLFVYPQQFAEDVFARLEQALRRHVFDGEADADTRTGRVIILPDDHPDADGAHRAEAYDEQQLLNDRREGRCLLSYETPGGWVAITKGVLTDMLGAGRDLKIVGLPPAAAEALKLACPNLVIDQRGSVDTKAST